MDESIVALAGALLEASRHVNPTGATKGRSAPSSRKKLLPSHGKFFDISPFGANLLPRGSARCAARTRKEDRNGQNLGHRQNGSGNRQVDG